MYRHILVAVDGSECGWVAASQAFDLAKSLGAQVTAITVTPTWESLELSELALGHSEQQYEQNAKSRGDKRLQRTSELAREAGVSCQTVQVVHARPYQAIIETAKKYGCDLIVVGSHGRRGIEGFLLGSEARKVVTTSTISVLVCRKG